MGERKWAMRHAEEEEKSGGKKKKKKAGGKKKKTKKAWNNLKHKSIDVDELKKMQNEDQSDRKVPLIGVTVPSIDIRPFCVPLPQALSDDVRKWVSCEVELRRCEYRKLLDFEKNEQIKQSKQPSSQLVQARETQALFGALLEEGASDFPRRHVHRATKPMAV